MSTDTDIFRYVARNKVRFASPRGDLMVEQLWDVPLRSSNGDGFDLNAIAKIANKAVKALTEESFVDNVRTPLHERAEVTLEVVKAVIEAKLAEEVAAKKRADNKLEREKLLAALSDKQDGKLSKLSEDDLRKRIALLEV